MPGLGCTHNPNEGWWSAAPILHSCDPQPGMARAVEAGPALSDHLGTTIELHVPQKAMRNASNGHRRSSGQLAAEVEAT